MTKLSIVLAAALGLTACGGGSASVCDLGDDYEAACPVTTTYFEYGTCDDSACSDADIDLLVASVECDLAQEDPCAVNDACSVEYAATATVSMECLYGVAGLDYMTGTTTTTSTYTYTTTSTTM